MFDERIVLYDYDLCVHCSSFKFMRPFCEYEHMFCEYEHMCQSCKI